MESYSHTAHLSKNLFRRLTALAIFFTITPLAIVASVYSLIAISTTTPSQPEVKGALAAQTGINLYASLPDTLPSVSGHVISADARVELIRQYLASYHSPLEPYAELIVTTSDKYRLDYRLLTAIAMKESGLCKIIPEGSHNCWGWGIHSQGTLGFDNYPEAIETVSRGLKENYIDLGYISVEEIMSKYIPHSPGGAWATGVSAYMQEIK